MRWLMLLTLMLTIGTALAACSPGKDPTGVIVRDEWAAVFAAHDVEGTFVLREVGTDLTRVWDETRAREPRLPASTFKILNSLIALETGAVTSVDETIPWDGVDRGLDVWNQDHSLRTGIEMSAVWAYQRLARDVGVDQMADWVERASYGNADIGGSIDRFWLDGDLRISPMQQIDFLERLVTGDLPFGADATTAVVEILVREQGENWLWSHKTGTALSEAPVLGWLVGTTQHDGRSFVFAMNLDLASTETAAGQIDPQVRQQISRQILEAEGALPTR